MWPMLVEYAYLCFVCVPYCLYRPLNLLRKNILRLFTRTMSNCRYVSKSNIESFNLHKPTCYNSWFSSIFINTLNFCGTDKWKIFFDISLDLSQLPQCYLPKVFGWFLSSIDSCAVPVTLSLNLPLIGRLTKWSWQKTRAHFVVCQLSSLGHLLHFRAKFHAVTGGCRLGVLWTFLKSIVDLTLFNYQKLFVGNDFVLRKAYTLMYVQVMAMTHSAMIRHTNSYSNMSSNIQCEALCDRDSKCLS